MPSRAATLYLPEQKAIWIYDYPRGLPCTPRQILSANAMFEWGLVTYDATNDTYTVNANLWIGRNNDTDTYVQIGSHSHPRETLILKGNLVLHPWHIAGENKTSPSVVAAPLINRLTLGVADDPSVQAALKIHNEIGEYHTILSGRYFRGADSVTPPRCLGGQLHVYHSTITADVQDRAHAIGAAGNRHMYLPGYSGQVVLKGATLSWVAGAIGFGLEAGYSDIEDTVFEHSGYALINPAQVATNCVFRDLRTAILDWGGPIDANLTGCVFTNNDANWSLSRGRMHCVDCVLGPPRQGNLYKSWPEQKAGKQPYATFLSSRHLVVQVTDDAGTPVKGAQVALLNLQIAEDRPMAVTDEQGRTPGRGSPVAILLMQYGETATDIENQPRRTDYAYTLTVTAPGYQPYLTPNVTVSESWQTLRVALKK